MQKSLTLRVESQNVLEGIIDNLIKNQKYVLPQFQRDFDWEIKDVKNLLFSVFAGYPIGAILIWNNKEDDKITPISIREDEIFEEDPLIKYNPPNVDHLNKELLFILDGQQRTRSLFNSLFNPNIMIKYKKKKSFGNFLYCIFPDDVEDDLDNIDIDYDTAEHFVHYYNDLIKVQHRPRSLLIMTDIKFESNQKYLILDFQSLPKFSKDTKNKKKERIGQKYQMIMSKEVMKKEEIDKPNVLDGFYKLVDNKRQIIKADDIASIKDAIIGITVNTVTKLSKPYENLITDWNSIWDRSEAIISFNSENEKIKTLIQLRPIINNFRRWLDKKREKLEKSLIAKIEISGEFGEMADIFAYLNMSGVKLSNFDLMVAKTFSKEFYLRDYFDNIVKEKEKSLVLPFFIDKAIFCDQNRSNPKDISDKYKLLILKSIGLLLNNKVDEKLLLKSDKTKIKDFFLSNNKSEIFISTLNETIKFLDENFRINNISYLRFELLFPIIHAIFYKISDYKVDIKNKDIKNKDIKELKITELKKEILVPWFWRIIFRSDFGRSPKTNSKTQYNFLLKIWEEFLKSKGKINDEIKLILEESTKNYALPTIKALEDEIKRGKTPTPINFLPFEDGAKDLKFGKSSFNFKCGDQYHHIFPIDLLSKIKNLDADNPLNILIISGGVNNDIKNKDPKKYFKDYANDYEKMGNGYDYKEILSSNYIPNEITKTRKSKLESRYEEFLSLRANLIINKIKKLQKR